MITVGNIMHVSKKGCALRGTFDPLMRQPFLFI